MSRYTIHDEATGEIIATAERLRPARRFAARWAEKWEALAIVIDAQRRRYWIVQPH